MRETDIRIANIQYSLLQSTYWAFACVCYAYLTYYLVSNGYTTGGVGTILAVFGIISVPTQILAGKATDTFGTLDWRIMLLALSLAGIIVAGLLFFITDKTSIGLIFGLLFLIMNTMRPMVNAACFDYIGRGIKINFGVARGMGSLVYAIVSLILGMLTVRMGTLPVRIVAVLMLAAVFAVTFSMSAGSDAAGDEPRCQDETQCKGDALSQNATTARAGFVQKYPNFLLMVGGVTLFMFFHGICNDYMLQIMERVGGNSGNMGMAISLAAVIELPILFTFSFIIKRCSADKLLGIAGVCYIFRVISLMLASSVGAVYLSQCFQLITYALYASASVYYTDDMIEDKDRVTGHAFMTNTDTVGTLTGAFFGGLLIERGGIDLTLKVCLAAVIIGAIAILSSIAMNRKKPAYQTDEK